MNARRIIRGGPRSYYFICGIVVLSVIVSSAFIIILNYSCFRSYLVSHFSERLAFLFQVPFWAALGASLDCYKFAADDRQDNEDAFRNKDIQQLAWPNVYNVMFYGLRIIMGGVMGCIGTVILVSGLGALDVSDPSWLLKHKLWILSFCAIIGYSQDSFLQWINTIKKNMFKDRSEKDKPEGNDQRK